MRLGGAGGAAGTGAGAGAIMATGTGAATGTGSGVVWIAGGVAVGVRTIGGGGRGGKAAEQRTPAFLAVRADGMLLTLTAVGDGLSGVASAVSAVPSLWT